MVAGIYLRQAGFANLDFTWFMRFFSCWVRRDLLQSAKMPIYATDCVFPVSAGREYLQRVRTTLA